MKRSIAFPLFIPFLAVCGAVKTLAAGGGEEVSLSVTPISLAAADVAEAQTAVRARLRDPDSARFTELQGYRIESGNEFACGMVNSRNAFGGYAGPSPFSVWVDDGVAGVVEIDDADSSWAARECLNAAQGRWVMDTD